MLGKIISYSVENYGSFAEECILDFTQNLDNIKNNNNVRYYKKYDKRFNVLFGLYGKNASGKSNLLGSLIDHMLCIYMPAKPKYNPFLLDEKYKNEATKSKLSFVFQKDVYMHEFHYNNSGIIYEKLIKNDIIIFEILDKKIIFDKSIDETLKNDFYTRHANNNYNNTVLIRYFMLHFSGDYRVNILPPELKAGFSSDEGNTINNQFLSFFDNDIKQISFDGVGQIQTTHINNLGENVVFDLSLESEGTRRLVFILPKLIDAIKNGGMVIIDEIEKTLHPVALKFIINLFKNKDINKKGATLVFSSHNFDTLDWLDKENIIIIDKIDGKSSINCPNDYNKKTFKKDLMDGSYGSILSIDLNQYSFINNIWQDE